MERPAKRQKVSQGPVFPVPTRTLDLTNFQRPQNQRRNAGKVILPRAPDVTVTAGVLEVAVNDGSTATQIAAPTTDVAVTLESLGTLTVPGVSTSTGSSSDSNSAPGSESNSQPSSLASSSEGTLSSSPGSSSGQLTTIVSSNSTAISTSQRTVTVTETSTFHVSYSNGTFIAATSTPSATKTDSDSDDENTSDSSTDFESSSSKYVFGQGVTDTYTPYTTPTGTDYGNAAVGATATGAGSVATSSGGSGDGSDSGNNSPSGPVLTPQQTQMVGGIVGGVAGIALVLVVVLYVLRWYRQRLKQQGRLPEQLTSGHSRGGSGLITSAAPMSQNSRSSFFAPAVMASGMKKWRTASDMTTLTNTTSTTGADSEKGFQRVSGRKIPSVLSTGGDQFGGSYGAFEKEIGPPPRAPHHRHDLSESSFYRDAEGTYIGSSTNGEKGHTRPASRSLPTTPIYPTVFTSPGEPMSSRDRRPSLANLSERRDFAPDAFNNALYRSLTTPKVDGVAVFRGSPARTPVTQSPNTSSIRLPIQAPVTMDEDVPEMPLGSPGLGGYHHGVNGGQPRRASRLSERDSGRFREEVA